MLYQKTGLTISRMAQDFMSRAEGERIPPISEYEERFHVSRGTVQNSLTYLKEQGAVSLISRGHMGTYIQNLDYRKLQNCCLNKGLLGAMPLPMTFTRQSIATTLYHLLPQFNIDLAYIRGVETRLQLTADGVCQFAVCSRYSARECIKNHAQVEEVVDFGPGTYIQHMVLLLRDPGASGIKPGMRVAYDRHSLDFRRVTDELTKGVRGIKLVETRSNQGLSAIQEGIVDAAVWEDDVTESIGTGIGQISLDGMDIFDDLSSAVLVVRKGEEPMRQIFARYIRPEEANKIRKKILSGKMRTDY